MGTGLNNKKTYWFKHYFTALDNPKIDKLRSELKVEGYGIFNMILEVMGKQENYEITKQELIIYLKRYQVSAKKIEKVLENYEIFSKKTVEISGVKVEKFFQKEFKEDMSFAEEKRSKLRDNGSIGGLKKQINILKKRLAIASESLVANASVLAESTASNCYKIATTDIDIDIDIEKERKEEEEKKRDINKVIIKDKIEENKNINGFRNITDSIFNFKKHILKTKTDDDDDDEFQNFNIKEKELIEKIENSFNCKVSFNKKIIKLIRKVGVDRAMGSLRELIESYNKNQNIQNKIAYYTTTLANLN